jgi:hypothetical protein
MPRSRWVYHPKKVDEDSRDIDVAIMKLTNIKDREVVTFRYEGQESVDKKDNQLPFQDPEPPQPILLFGFPGDIGFELTEQRPMGRSGIISMVTGKKYLKIDNKYVDEKAYLIDVSAYPGNSGSPVINQFIPLIDPNIKLLGLLSAGNQNMKYAIIMPVSRIRETIEVAKDQSIEGFHCCFLLMNKKHTVIRLD